MDVRTVPRPDPGVCLVRRTPICTELTPVERPEGAGDLRGRAEPVRDAARLAAGRCASLRRRTWSAALRWGGPPPRPSSRARFTSPPPPSPSPSPPPPPPSRGAGDDSSGVRAAGSGRGSPVASGPLYPLSAGRGAHPLPDRRARRALPCGPDHGPRDSPPPVGAGRRAETPAPGARPAERTRASLTAPRASIPGSTRGLFTPPAGGPGLVLSFPARRLRRLVSTASWWGERVACRVGRSPTPLPA
jgi:hypothetical protein